MNKKQAKIIGLGLLAFMLQAVLSVAYAQDDKPSSVPMSQVEPKRPQSVVREGMVLLQGVVKDAQGETLPGAHVRIRDTKAGALTDDNGVLTLSVPQGKSVVVDVSFVDCDLAGAGIYADSGN